MVMKMGAEAFRVILTMTVVGTALALALFALKPLIRNRIPKTAQYGLWLVALAAFLIPVPALIALPGSGMLSGFIEERVISGSEYVEQQMLERTGHSAQISIAEAEMMSAEDKEQTIQVRADAEPVAFWLDFLVTKLPFVGGFAVFFALMLNYWAFALRLREGNKRVDKECRVPVFTNPQVKTPMLVGLIRPIIVLPQREYAPAQLDCMLRHELTHLKRKDILVKWLTLIACSIHWFNPIAWLMSREISRACELACDEAVMRGMDKSERQTYGNMLISVAADSAMPRSSLATLMCEEKRTLKERLGAILAYKKHTGAAILISALLIGAAALAVFALGAGSGETLDYRNEPHFTGIVTEAYETGILVKANEGEDIRRSSDLFHVSLSAEIKDSNRVFSVGDEVTVYFDGTIAESYPAQIFKVYAIDLSKESSAVIPEESQQETPVATKDPAMDPTFAIYEAIPSGDYLATFPNRNSVNPDDYERLEANPETGWIELRGTVTVVATLPAGTASFTLFYAHAGTNQEGISFAEGGFDKLEEPAIVMGDFAAEEWFPEGFHGHIWVIILDEEGVEHYSDIVNVIYEPEANNSEQ
jgi:beta-lactamase regulating signal transducer with metallopeptidase domain